MPKFGSALIVPEQASPANPASGFLSVFAKSGGVLWTRNAAGTERLVEPGLLFPFSRAGALAVAVGTHRLYNDTGSSLAIRGVRASVGTAPTGAAIIVDVNINGTTIWSTQANRPTIAIGANTSGKVTNYNTATIADGAYFSIDIDQVGSTVAGSDLTVQILC
ncbi:hypothetical protein ACFFMN_23630 [Planobispora siamensis]|uniref:Uncharacterized protein n=1 Tax=Planobispora siamensis TaxID=936338 RepID=A0A8J3WQ00_9ACTN|nr:hypothetical protein [Planobispora siamensis]GIH95356.1 hypothetical protein Psi01_59860 [Planobispora siamensis]